MSEQGPKDVSTDFSVAIAAGTGPSVHTVLTCRFTKIPASAAAHVTTSLLGAG